METVVFFLLGAVAIAIIGLVCHQYFFLDSFHYDEDDKDEQ